MKHEIEKETQDGGGWGKQTFYNPGEVMSSVAFVFFFIVKVESLATAASTRANMLTTQANNAALGQVI